MRDSIDMALSRAQTRRRLPPPAVRRSLRLAAGLSQQDIAAPLRVTRECIAQWEKGARTPRGDRAEQYLAILDRCRSALATMPAS